MSAQNEKQSLKALREKAGITQQELAHQMGVAIATVSNWERGTSELSARSLLKLAEMFEVSPFDIALPEPEKGRRGKAAA